MEDSLNLRDRNLDFYKCTFYATMSYAGCPGPSLANSVQFTLKISDAAGNRKKNHYTPILEVQNHSKSSTLTKIKSLSLWLVMISSMSTFKVVYIDMLVIITRTKNVSLH